MRVDHSLRLPRHDSVDPIIIGERGTYLVSIESLTSFPAMIVPVLLFAKARDLAGTDRIELRVPASATLVELKAELSRQCPPLATISDSLLWAINNQYAGDSSIIHEADSVACFPPVSGG